MHQCLRFGHPVRVGTRIFDQWLSFSRISQRCFGEKLVAPQYDLPYRRGLAGVYPICDSVIVYF
jgi:hypothetical protein